MVKSFRRNTLVVLTSVAVVSFLFGYVYLGALRGVALFKFLLDNVLGSTILSLAIALYTYYTAKNITISICDQVELLKPSLIEDLYLLIFTLALLTLIYPISRAITEVHSSFLNLPSVLLTLTTSLLMLAVFSGVRRVSIVVLSYVGVIILTLIAYIRHEEVSKSFTELVELVSLIEVLIKELGVV
ncbi:MAG: hypothetical protein RMI56_05570 [Sulfolobales archaeon]|nr:hypothetical protein [Sulfolobales archaeon]MDW8083248.1 hypothetical protein [Sulfolobales archaeon]